jgi:hypothetical protein
MTQRFLLPLLAAALVAGGCGSAETGGDDSLAALDRAAKATADTESFRQRFTMESDLPEEQMSMEGEGTFSADSTRGRMKATMDTGSERMTFEGITIDGVMYLKSDEIPVPAGKEWLKMQDPPTSTLSPSEFVRFLRDSDDVKNVGTEEIRGEKTTHFRGPLDIKKLAEESGTELVKRLRQTPGVDDMEFLVDVWVTQDGLPARVAAKISMPEQSSGGLTITSDILEFDVDVNAKAPPADKVATASG